MSHKISLCVGCKFICRPNPEREATNTNRIMNKSLGYLLQKELRKSARIILK